MKHPLIPIVLALSVSATAVAQKPESTGEDRPSGDERGGSEMRDRAQGRADEARHMSDSERREMERGENMRDSMGDMERERMEAMEKQREKKQDQVQKETGKGSEQGQEAREKRRKWWKFWGD